MEQFPIKSIHGNEHLFITEEGKAYDVFALIHEANNIPVEEINPNEIESSLDNECWDDLSGKIIKPREVMDILARSSDWEEVGREYPDLKEHIEKIRNADYSHPILLSPEGILLDGVHRLIKALLEKAQKIPVRKFLQLPESAKHEDKR